MNNSIEINCFTKKYDKFTAVHDISLQVAKGSIFGLLGPNGAGKTTTIKAMTGRLSLSSGSISILGFDILKDIKNIHQQIGVVSETQNLYEHLSVYENIDFFRQIYNVPKERSFEVIKELGLEDKTNEKVSNLSKGLKQRVLLGRSILHSPKVLFLDEPTSGLDPSSSHSVIELIKKIKSGGTTIFLTTHDMEEADLLCDQIAFINKGRVIAVDSPKSLKDKFGTSEIEITYLVEGVEKTEVHSLKNIDVFSIISNIHNSHKILSLHTKEATMKDVFLNITKNTGELS